MSRRTHTSRLAAALLLGSVPFAQWVARVAAAQDLRRVDNGTVSATGVFRVAGHLPFVAVCLLDVGKGATAALMIRHLPPGTRAVGAGLVVVGHNWSPFLQGAGGRGVLPALGALAVAHPTGAAVLLGGILGGYARGDTAPGCFLAQTLLTPLLALTGGRRAALFGAAVAAPMLAKRIAGNGTYGRPASARTYWTRAVYDRDRR
ncbi:hypothetical protein GCE86_08790 [Micromonospora terminaliae]|uniref:Glycerol-3-phosphate acyltransferase n=1 Tax=Micromonospora terminaliae TaxID=1914461 RepID=A0AAJ2ZEE1_9ACTN|nr:glycerol-3-phosphate acyltransferase [Micromonospora terminaliae]NES28116.1 glycerol-3-phosphate acyltransferase [Micromonospora terminaliae]QGL47138.1 hypothetical protein GCE86_08790 [Micromonospora terminaliae]